MALLIAEHKQIKPGKTFGAYTVLINGKLTQAALKTGPGTVMVKIIINDKITNCAIYNKEISLFKEPIVVARGDVIKIRTVASSGDSGNVIGADVSMLIETI